MTIYGNIGDVDYKLSKSGLSLSIRPQTEGWYSPTKAQIEALHALLNMALYELDEVGCECADTSRPEPDCDGCTDDEVTGWGV
jgi:hypothetical protein